jgi:hypothetical protein
MWRSRKRRAVAGGAGAGGAGAEGARGSRASRLRDGVGGLRHDGGPVVAPL